MQSIASEVGYGDALVYKPRFRPTQTASLILSIQHWGSLAKYFPNIASPWVCEAYFAIAVLRCILVSYPDTCIPPSQRVLADCEAFRVSLSTPNQSARPTQVRIRHDIGDSTLMDSVPVPAATIIKVPRCLLDAVQFLGMRRSWILVPVQPD